GSADGAPAAPLPPVARDVPPRLPRRARRRLETVPLRRLTGTLGRPALVAYFAGRAGPPRGRRRSNGHAPPIPHGFPVLPRRPADVGGPAPPIRHRGGPPLGRRPAAGGGRGGGRHPGRDREPQRA